MPNPEDLTGRLHRITSRSEFTDFRRHGTRNRFSQPPVPRATARDWFPIAVYAVLALAVLAQVAIVLAMAF
jgi:hypothetical protein